ncbi:uncharacterized protein LOC123301623 [Chrysoperla carnea]|uniref:uncharacterized protein LOC123301623 n=1 Tax=Chrysoperla carnea TaxID=189513 RepID=UPI001D066BA9|nr:uncharacterized protein LOC123301623 [Chrysoperla carnea]
MALPESREKKTFATRNARIVRSARLNSTKHVKNTNPTKNCKKTNSSDGTRIELNALNAGLNSTEHVENTNSTEIFDKTNSSDVIRIERNVPGTRLEMKSMSELPQSSFHTNLNLIRNKRTAYNRNRASLRKFKRRQFIQGKKLEQLRKKKSTTKVKPEEIKPVISSKSVERKGKGPDADFFY